LETSTQTDYVIYEDRAIQAFDDSEFALRERERARFGDYEVRTEVDSENTVTRLESETDNGTMVENTYVTTQRLE
jgi:hypothetical protein